MPKPIRKKTKRVLLEDFGLTNVPVLEIQEFIVKLLREAGVSEEQLPNAVISHHGEEDCRLYCSIFEIESDEAYNKRLQAWEESQLRLVKKQEEEERALLQLLKQKYESF